jgi:toxin YhaV
VKLLAAVMEGIKERIAADPDPSRFALSGSPRRYGRLKGLGLPDRYRLFFRPFLRGQPPDQPVHSVL